VENDDDFLYGVTSSEWKRFGVLWTNNTGEELIVGTLHECIYVRGNVAHVARVSVARHRRALA
jgi:hypothetical protein